jgi:hypothetical protein
MTVPRMSDINEAIDPLREALIAACTAHKIERAIALGAIAVLLGLEGANDNVDRHAFLAHVLELVDAGYFAGQHMPLDGS